MSIARLKALRDVGRSLMASPRTNTLGFGTWDCGTHACFAGHYERQTGARVLDVELRPPYSATVNISRLAEHFGITDGQAMALFRAVPDDPGARCRGVSDPNYPGRAAYGELELRLRLLDAIIAEKELRAEAPKLSVVAS